MAETKNGAGNFAAGPVALVQSCGRLCGPGTKPSTAAGGVSPAGKIGVDEAIPLSFRNDMERGPVVKMADDCLGSACCSLCPAEIGVLE